MIKAKQGNMLLKRTKVGYGVGAIADCIIFDFVGVFLLFFLTEAVGLKPSFAGAIIFISVLWDAITDPIIGMWSDATKCKYGKKRPFIIASAIPMGITMVLLFTVVDFNIALKNAYYLIIAMLFWTSYTAFNIPYFALGGCLTVDHDERTSLAGYREICGSIGVLFASALPALFIGLLKDNGFSISDSYFYTAIILGAIITLTIFITWRSTRGKEIVGECRHSISFKGIVDIYKIKSYFILNVVELGFYIGYTFLNSATLYFTTYILGLGETEAGILFLISTICAFVYVPIITKTAIKFDKKMVCLVTLIISGAASIVGYFVTVDSMFEIAIVIILINIGMVTLFTLIYPMFYDIVDIDEFKSGSRREGLIISFASFIIKLGTAAAAAIAGFILEFNGYVADAPEQVPSALAAIKGLITLGPGICMIIIGALLIFYPVTKKRYKALMENLELKKAGREYTTQGFEELL